MTISGAFPYTTISTWSTLSPNALQTVLISPLFNSRGSVTRSRSWQRYSTHRLFHAYNPASPITLPEKEDCLTYPRASRLLQEITSGLRAIISFIFSRYFSSCSLMISGSFIPHFFCSDNAFNSKDEIMPSYIRSLSIKTVSDSDIRAA